MGSKINWPKISIVIPTFNRKVFMKPCLDSIFKQDYPKEKIEVLVVDAGSTDGTVELAKKYPVKVVPITDPLAQKVGEPGKILGYKNVTGEIYTYFDSDAEYVSRDLFRNLAFPFLDDPSIVGSFTRYVPSPRQSAYNRYLSYNELQLWPMLSYLLPTIADITIEKRKKYDVVEIDPEKAPPIGLCFYRKKFLDKVIIRPDEFNYVDIAIPLQLSELGYSKFAYIEKAGMYHRRDWGRELYRQKRDVTVTYLPVIGRRKFNYINFKDPFDLAKVILWIIYVNLIVPSLLVGIYKTIKYKDLAGLYELPVNFLLTNYIIFLFLIDPNGRKLLGKIFRRQT